MNEANELIEYRGFKNIFIGLGKEDKKYYILYGKTGRPSINSSCDSMDCYGGLENTPLVKFYGAQEVTIDIPFLVTYNTPFHILSIDSPKDYKQIVSVLETLL